MSADGLHQMRDDRRGRAAGLVASHAAGPAAGGGKAFIAGPERPAARALLKNKPRRGSGGVTTDAGREALRRRSRTALRAEGGKAGTADYLTDLDVLPEPEPVGDLLHRGARRLVGPGRTGVTRAADNHIVELDAVGTGPIRTPSCPLFPAIPCALSKAGNIGSRRIRRCRRSRQSRCRQALPSCQILHQTENAAKPPRCVRLGSKVRGRTGVARVSKRAECAPLAPAQHACG